ncbi:MAG: hypothetical protein COB02_15890 [Candidatus Cloacimonadota bacterium]|nr:MAG: hypothetical protein COB02_15890 [Candidatus Cloacimonadota bacterium]
MRNISILLFVIVFLLYSIHIFLVTGEVLYFSKLNKSDNLSAVIPISNQFKSKSWIVDLDSNLLFGKAIVDISIWKNIKLLNPKNTEWHHPTEDSRVMRLLRKSEHRNSLLSGCITS